jgi:hypothetical protein
VQSGQLIGFDVSTARKRDNRRDIPQPVVDTDADAWQKGIILQVETKTLPPR